MGYHQSNIEKGVLGEFSKIREEFEEAKDAHDQNAKIMLLCELSDMIGAIELYLNKNFEGVTIADLIQMSNLTTQAFKDGSRS